MTKTCLLVRRDSENFPVPRGDNNMRIDFILYDIGLAFALGAVWCISMYIFYLMIR